MMCKKVVLYKNRTFLYKRCGFQAASLVRIRNIACNTSNPVYERKLSNGSNGIKNYILNSSLKQNRSNSGHASLIRNNNRLLKEPNMFYLNVDSRFLHSCISSLIIRSSAAVSNFRWNSTDVNSSSRLETMPGISINSDEILRSVSPTITTTDKILNIHYAENEETGQILILYPNPKSVLHTLFQNVSLKTKNKSLKVNPEYAPVTVQNQIVWISFYHVHWPEEIRFSGIDFTKRCASHKAAVTALTWLQKNGKITARGQPIFHIENNFQEEFSEIWYKATEEIRNIKGLFASPSKVLENIFLIVAKHYSNNSFKISPSYKNTRVCFYCILWPQKKKFYAIDTNKELARSKAAIVALCWLKGNGNITSDGLPILEIFYDDSEEAKQTLKLYPSPDAVSTEISKQTNTKFTLSPWYQSETSGGRTTWTCLYHIFWPYETKFLSKDSTKKLASQKAAIAVILWFKRMNKITTKIDMATPKIYYDDNEEPSQILKWNPHPETILENLFNKMTAHIDKSLKLIPRYEHVRSEHAVHWICWYHMQWPEEIKFFATDICKHSAQQKAAATVLTWLKNNTNVNEIDMRKTKVRHKKHNNAKVIKKPVTVREIYYSENDNSKQTLKQFPNAKNVLHNIFDEISRQTNKKGLKLTPHYKLVKGGKQSIWQCTYHIYWPEEIKFLANDSKKGVASHKAALAALTWLKENQKVTKDGLPVTYGKEEVKAITKKALPVISLDQATVDKMQNVIHLHRTQIVPHIIENKLDKAEKGDELEDEESHAVTITEDVKLKDIRKQRYLGLEIYAAKEKVDLPIAAYKDDFINLLKENQVIIVKGQPGCGKSTRVPQYVLEAWAKEEGLLGEPGRVAVTQPRRIAAISLAERVSIERDEAVGNIVGYQVRLKSNFKSATGKLLYCTTGILLRHLQSDPNLSTFSHVILDEAHERDVNTDLLMNLLRGACKRNPKLKLIVMSATIDTEMFSEYFGGAPIMDVPGFTHPVKQHFLDSCSKIDLSKTQNMCEGNVPTVIHEDVARVIQFIHQKKKDGAILCFLPGWEDISKIQKLIPNRGDIAVYCLHSRLQDSDQWKIFSKPPPGVRKVILATNIAETSVTIDDVVYVIDTGIHKEQRFDIEKGVTCIDNHWISKASANQRKGRAGRVQPGESYHLYSRDKYKSFPDYSIPEIQRTSLTKIVLDSKVFSNNMDALEFMSKLPTPPDENATLRAVEELKDLEMLDKEENLTSLGKTCADFQLEPKLSKALISAVIFKCVTPIVDIVTLFSADTEFFVSGMLRKEDIRMTKRQFCKHSDHLAMMRIFEKWLEHSEEGDSYSLRRFCNESNLVPYRMDTINKLRKIHYDYLYHGLYDVLPISDDLSDNDEMVKAVLYSGIGTVLQHRNWDIVKHKLKNNVNCLLTRNNHRATITTESVNHKRNKFSTNFLLYINETRSNIRRTTLIRECSLIPNISVLLFSNKDLEIKDVPKENFSQDISSQDQVKIGIVNTNIELLCDRTQAQDLVECKNAVMAAYRYYIEQLTDTAVHNSDVNTAWDSILALISDILTRNSVKN